MAELSLQARQERRQQIFASETSQLLLTRLLGGVCPAWNLMNLMPLRIGGSELNHHRIFMEYLESAGWFTENDSEKNKRMTGDP